MELKDLRKAAVEFLDNGGGQVLWNTCDYCKGKKIQHHLIIQTKQLFL